MIISMAKDFYEAIKDRRSFYEISGETTISDERILEVVSHCVLNVPSAFNSQSARVVVLFGKNHARLWDITLETLRRIVPEGQFGATEQKIASFANGYATILYFNDTKITNGLCEKFPLYQDKFSVWAQQANGMLQFAVWTSLEIEGLGASLQHYNPLIDDEAKAAWGIPNEWQLIAQMPFGKPTGQPSAKEFVSIEERLKVFR